MSLLAGVALGLGGMFVLLLLIVLLVRPDPAPGGW